MISWGVLLVYYKPHSYIMENTAPKWWEFFSMKTCKPQDSYSLSSGVGSFWQSWKVPLVKQVTLRLCSSVWRFFPLMKIDFIYDFVGFLVAHSWYLLLFFFIYSKPFNSSPVFQHDRQNLLWSGAVDLSSLGLIFFLAPLPVLQPTLVSKHFTSLSSSNRLFKHSSWTVEFRVFRRNSKSILHLHIADLFHLMSLDCLLSAQTPFPVQRASLDLSSLETCFFIVSHGNSYLRVSWCSTHCVVISCLLDGSLTQAAISLESRNCVLFYPVPNTW